MAMSRSGNDTTRICLKIAQFLRPFSSLIDPNWECTLVERVEDAGVPYKKFDSDVQLLSILIGLVKHVAATPSTYVDDLFQDEQSASGDRPSRLDTGIQYGNTNWYHVVKLSMKCSSISTSSHPYLNSLKKVNTQKKALQLGKMCASPLKGFAKYSGLTAFLIVLLYSAKGDRVLDEAILAKADQYLAKYFPSDFPGLPHQLRVAEYTIELDTFALDVPNKFPFAGKLRQGTLLLPIDGSSASSASSLPLVENVTLEGYGSLTKTIRDLDKDTEKKQDDVESLTTQVNQQQLKIVENRAARVRLMREKTRLDYMNKLGELMMDFAETKSKDPLDLFLEMKRCYETCNGDGDGGAEGGGESSREEEEQYQPCMDAAGKRRFEDEEDEADESFLSENPYEDLILIPKQSSASTAGGRRTGGPRMRTPSRLTHRKKYKLDANGQHSLWR